MRDISLHLMDIIQNSILANASKIHINISTVKDKDTLSVAIIDNGKGMEPEFLKKVTDPFVTTRTTRDVGLGISLFKSSAEQADGFLRIESEVGKGTTLEVSFKITSIDRIPLGDIGDTMSAVMATNENIDFHLELKSHKEEFSVSTSEIKEQLGEVPISQIEVMIWLKEYINEATINVFGGVLNEIYS